MWNWQKWNTIGYTTLTWPILTFQFLKSSIRQESTNFPKSTSHLQIMGARKVIWSSTLKTHNSGVTYEPHNYLVLSVHCMWTHTFQYVKKNYSNLAENIWQHCTNFSFLGSQVFGISIPLLYDNEDAWNSNLNFLLTFSPQNKQAK